MIEEVDVLVVGSGGAGMLAALRASDLGLMTMIVEKAHFYGGTTATSGGVMWIPDHGLAPDLADSPERALTYLRAATAGLACDQRLQAYVTNARRMVEYLCSLGIHPTPLTGFPDYMPWLPGTTTGRSLYPPEFDGREIGDDYFRMRSPNSIAMLFGRYTLNMRESHALMKQQRGWMLTAARIILRYWLDIPQRLRSRRDRRATRGDALIGAMRRELLKRNVPLLLGTSLESLEMAAGRAVGALVRSNGASRLILARKGIVLAAGGFEQDQFLRDTHFTTPSNTTFSMTPHGGNTGDALRAGRAVGAASAFLDHAWWSPVMQLPSNDLAGEDVTHGLNFDQANPNSIFVNRRGDRFVNENASYDLFGQAMIADNELTGANNPCWMIFDDVYRQRHPCGGLMPKAAMPDWRVPRHWWDSYIYRSDSLEGLAAKIEVPHHRLEATVSRFNSFCKEGEDLDFQRGRNAYDIRRGDIRVRPNPCLGPIERAPFYAVPVYLGDLGTKGGLKCDENARVLDGQDRVISGLYAAGNAAASPFGNAYPGGGGTIGPALTFALLAAEHIAKTE